MKPKYNDAEWSLMDFPHPLTSKGYASTILTSKKPVLNVISWFIIHYQNLSIYRERVAYII